MAFDVFFSYSTPDHGPVERVARELTDRGVRVFLDRWYLAPGLPWPDELAQKLYDCNAVAVFIGADGLGPWQQRERDLALDRQAREPGFPVIPVLLTREDPGLGFLKLNTWVDLTANVADPQALTILIAAIRREPAGPPGLERIAAVRAAICPYRGLRPFREEDEPFFFGRDTFTETLTAAVAREPFVAVVGASGSGKSSVVRAGLIPRLRSRRDGLVWECLTFFPTDRPLRSLAAALLPMLEPDLSEVDRLKEVRKLAEHLTDDGDALSDAVARIIEKQRGTDRLLLFVDQWEELYTLCADQAVRQAVVNHLLHVAATDRVRVVLTLRGDFMGYALADRALSDQLQNAVVTVGPMNRRELAETITKPAEKTGLTFEHGLVETILDDVGNEPGGLPLLEFLLEGLWAAERRGNVLMHDAYTRLGRVGGAIAHRAEEVFDKRLTDAEREAAHRLLIRMVRPGEGAEDTRRRATIPEDDPVAAATILKLAEERLVVTERDPGSGAVTVEVAHETLIRRWKSLRDWVDQDREFLRTRDRIAGLAELWAKESRSPDRLLSPGRPLAEGEDLLASRRADLEALHAEYIEASVAEARAGEAEKRAREEAERATERRRARIAKIFAAVMGIFAIGTGMTAVYAFVQRSAANHARELLSYVTLTVTDISGLLPEETKLLLDESANLVRAGVFGGGEDTRFIQASALLTMAQNAFNNWNTVQAYNLIKNVKKNLDGLSFGGSDRTQLVRLQASVLELSGDLYSNDDRYSRQAANNFGAALHELDLISSQTRDIAIAKFRIRRKLVALKALMGERAGIKEELESISASLGKGDDYPEERSAFEITYVETLGDETPIQEQVQRLQRSTELARSALTNAELGRQPTSALAALLTEALQRLGEVLSRSDPGEGDKALDEARRVALGILKAYPNRETTRFLLELVEHNRVLADDASRSREGSGAPTRSTQIQDAFGSGIGRFHFEMTPEQVNQLLPSPFRDLSFNTLPRANEYRSGEVRYFHVRRLDTPDFHLITQGVACLVQSSDVVFMFHRNQLFKISFRLLKEGYPDVPAQCPQRSEFLTQISERFHMPVSISRNNRHFEWTALTVNVRGVSISDQERIDLLHVRAP